MVVRSLLLGVAALFAAALPAMAEEPAFISFGAGYYDMFDDQSAGEARLEYRFSEAQKLYVFTPVRRRNGNNRRRHLRLRRDRSRHLPWSPSGVDAELRGRRVRQR